jgi:hypothetical protein
MISVRQQARVVKRRLHGARQRAPLPGMRQTLVATATMLTRGLQPVAPCNRSHEAGLARELITYSRCMRLIGAPKEEGE